MSKKYKLITNRRFRKIPLLDLIEYNAPSRLKTQSSINKDVTGSLEDCQKAWIELKTGYRRRKYQLLAVIYAISQILYNNESEWNTFLESSYFNSYREKPKPGNRRDLFRATVNYVVRPQNDQGRASASKMAGVLVCLMDELTPVHEVAAAIEKNGGIEKIYRCYTKNNSNKASGVGAIRSDKTSESADDWEENFEPELVSEASTAPSASKTQGRSSKLLNNGEITRWPIELETTDRRHDRLLSMEDGQQATIRVVCRGRDKDNWLRIEAVGVKLTEPEEEAPMLIF